MKTYISRELRLHTTRINYPNGIWNKLNKLFDKVVVSQVMQLEKEFISLNPLSLYRIDFSHVKEI